LDIFPFIFHITATSSLSFRSNKKACSPTEETGDYSPGNSGGTPFLRQPGCPFSEIWICRKDPWLCVPWFPRVYPFGNLHL